MSEMMCTGSSSWIRPAKRLSIYIRDQFSCLYCGRSLKDSRPEEMGLDHLEGLVAGGGHKGANNEATNLVTCCRACNSSRRDREWTEFAPGGAVERINVQRYLPLNLTLAKALIAEGTKWSDR